MMEPDRKSSYYGSVLLDAGTNQDDALSQSDESDGSDGDGSSRKRKRPMNVT